MATYSFSRLDGVGDAELVVGDDPEGVAGRGDQVLVGEGVLLDGAALCPRLRLPFVFVWNVSSGKKVIKDRSRLVLIGSCINIKQWAAFLNRKIKKETQLWDEQQKIKWRNVERQKVERQKVERQKVERQNVERQKVEQQKIERHFSGDSCKKELNQVG